MRSPRELWKAYRTDRFAGEKLGLSVDLSCMDIAPEWLTSMGDRVARAYEEIARANVLERVTVQAPQRNTATRTARRPQSPLGAPASAPAPPTRTEQNQLAARSRRLGDAYLASYQYPKAAEAFERALTLREDPTLHAKLAFIYGRMLHDAEKAQLHAALASSTGQDPTVTALGSVAQAQGLPRKGWQLLWNWLTQ